ncbi:hypothetical protein HaLaN_32427, partial [Haematococcus lacustris]
MSRNKKRKRPAQSAAGALTPGPQGLIALWSSLPKYMGVLTTHHDGLACCSVALQCSSALCSNSYLCGRPLAWAWVTGHAAAC